MPDSFVFRKKNPDNKVIALAGNPNVGKSTLFNNLTGMKQHTGNWAGKTVDIARGYAKSKNNNYVFVDLPGTYSIFSDSPEELIARDFLCFENPDATVIVCDATLLERNLNLVLQIREFVPRCILCLNLMDEAKKKKVHIDTDKLSEILKIPVISTIAKHKKGFGELMNILDKVIESENDCYKIKYPKDIEKLISELESLIDVSPLNSRWIAIKLLENNTELISSINTFLNKEIVSSEISEIIEEAEKKGIKDRIVYTIISEAEKIAEDVIRFPENQNRRDRRLDMIFTGKFTAFPIMAILMGIIFYITITGANYPSELISKLLFSFEDEILYFLKFIHLPEEIINMLVFGVYKVLCWVVSVMLPPMAIFFPLFTILEDSGYLPRIAYNLDRPFKKCNACGKQALTMCMGFGCNACGVTGCRIISSPRERLLAILTNSFVPCNGRFPALITLISIFFVTSEGMKGSVVSSLILTLVIILSVGATFIATYFLSKTFLKGIPSSFTLELPSYRTPQVGKVIIRSLFDRTIFVLGRAIAIAAPAGMVIWLMANITIGGSSLLRIFSGFLDPLGKLMGLDGMILMAFILGLPANEIVLPIIIMGYMAEGNIAVLPSAAVTASILKANGWTVITAISTVIFIIMHWPCSTTLLTVKKETGSIRWMFISALLPTIAGISACIIFNGIARLFLLT